MVERVLRVVLLLYPADFRDRFSAEVLLDFQRVKRDGRTRARALLFVSDLLAAGLRERVRALPARMIGLAGVTFSAGHFAYDFLVPDSMGVQAGLMTTVIGAVGLHLFTTRAK